MTRVQRRVDTSAAALGRAAQALESALSCGTYGSGRAHVATGAAVARITFGLHAGVAASGMPVRVEGPFGTMDAQGFTITERGRVAQFAGPARLVLNGGKP